MPGRLESRSIIITGGASGIGKAAVLHCLHEGARVVCGDLNVREGVAFRDELREMNFGDGFRFFPCDVAEETDIRTTRRYG